MDTSDSSSLFLPAPPVKIKINKKISKRLLSAPKNFLELQSIIQEIMQRRAINNGHHTNTESFRSANESIATNEPLEITYDDADGDKTLIEDQHDYDIALEEAKKGNLLSICADTSEKKKNKHEKRNKHKNYRERGNYWRRFGRDYSRPESVRYQSPYVRGFPAHQQDYNFFHNYMYGADTSGWNPYMNQELSTEGPSGITHTLEILAGELLDNSGLLEPQNSLESTKLVSPQDPDPAHNTFLHINTYTENETTSQQRTPQPNSNIEDDTQIDVYIDFLKQAFIPNASESTNVQRHDYIEVSSDTAYALNQVSMDSEPTSSLAQRDTDDNQSNSDLQRLVANLSLQDGKSSTR